MRQLVALLRGVNVGGARQLPMAALRTTLETAGFSDVRTYLQSGNVVLRAEDAGTDAAAALIRRATAAEFDVDVDVLVLPCEQLVRIAAANPFVAENPSVDPGWLHVLFPFQPIAADTFAALGLLALEGERGVLGEGAIYLLLPHGMGRSKLPASLGRALKVPTTARNWRTVMALAALCGEGERPRVH
jgi:uncharacterized protein (DUF1697 family)